MRRHPNRIAAAWKRIHQSNLAGTRFARTHARVHAHTIKARHPLLTPRQRVVKWALWGVKHSAAFDYTQTMLRDDWLTLKPGHLTLPSFHIDTDCSGFVTLCYKWSGLPDPNGLGYKTLGYTGTLLDHASKILPTAEGLPGDLLVYGPGTGEHVVVLLEHAPDPLTATHGGPGVQKIRVSMDGRQPQRVCRTL
jgi:hypothetical protein